MATLKRDKEDPWYVVVLQVIGAVIIGVGTVVFWCSAAVLASFFVGCLAGTALEGFLMVTGL